MTCVCVCACVYMHVHALVCLSMETEERVDLICSNMGMYFLRRPKWLGSLHMLKIRPH